MGTPRRQRLYQPKRLQGENLEALRREMQEELDQLARTLYELTEFKYLPQGAEPEKFEEGSIRFFVGGIAVTGIASTTAGLHQFRAGAWRRLNDT